VKTGGWTWYRAVISRIAPDRTDYRHSYIAARLNIFKYKVF
jgi:hypothetical protein